MNSIDRIITEEALSWAMRESKARKNLLKKEKYPVITISREYGAGGKSLALELGKRIGFKIWDKELLSAIAEEAGADEKFMSSLDERRRKMIDDFLYGSFMGSELSNTQYFRSLLRVVHTIGEHGNSIIVGRGGNHIIKSSKALHVRLVLPFKDRIAAIAKSEGISKDQAEKVIIDRDKERNDFIQYYFKHDPTDPQEYDIVLNSGVFGIEKLADLVLYAYEKKTGKTIPELNMV